MSAIIEQLKSNLDEIGFPSYDSEELKAFSPEEVLLSMIKILDTQIKSTIANVKALKEVDEEVMHILSLANAMELLKMHLEFSIAILNSSSDEEVEKIKDKFILIREKYENVTSKRDLSPVPAKYSVAMMHDKIVAELKKLLQKCFQTNKQGDILLINKEENIARIRVMTGRFELCYSSFPEIITFPDDHLLRFEQSAPVWQDLHKFATFKELVTKEEVHTTSKFFHFGVHLSHIIINNQIRNRSNPYVKSVVSLILEILYYGFQSAKIETQALLYLLKPDVDEAFKAWNIPEKPVLSMIPALLAPMIAYDKRIFLPRLFPKITKETILKDYQDGTINKINPVDPKELAAPDLGDNRYAVVDELLTEDEEKVAVRILADENLDLKGTGPNLFQYMVQAAKKLIPTASQPEDTEEKAIVIHMHGGGFVAMTSATHRVYLYKWVKTLKLVHFSIDYRNAPQNPYPAAVDDVWQAYLWIINYATKILGIKHSKVILVGDSSGATLALALMYRLIRAGLPTPHGCLLFYPAYIMDSTYASPSYFESLDDVLLPYSLLRLIIEAYVEKDFKKREDPFLSPIVASDELLEKLPPMRIVTGSKDPLYDDNWRFLQKLTRLNKDVKMVVHAHLSHGYICHKLLKNYNFFLDEACELIQELISTQP